MTIEVDSHQVGIIGGGRWARQIAETFSRILPKDSPPIILFSPSAPENWRHWIDQSADRSTRFEAISNFDSILFDSDISHIAIARRAHRHAQTAIKALASKNSVFIEKPFATSMTEANNVVAASRNKVCVTGLVFLFAKNLVNFSKEIETIGPVIHSQVTWTDQTKEDRYGERKRYDISINVVLDILPHVLSVLHHIHKTENADLLRVITKRGGRNIQLEISFGPVTSDIHLERDSNLRRRRLDVQGLKGSAHIDFSTEPGFAKINGKPREIGHNFSSPLQRELECFLSSQPRDCENAPQGVLSASKAIALAQAATQIIRKEQSDLIVSGLNAKTTEAIDEDVSYAIEEIVTEKLAMENISTTTDAEQTGLVTTWLTSHETPANLLECLLTDPRISAIRQQITKR